MGSFFVQIIMLNVMPNFETNKVKLTLLLSSLFPFLALLLGLCMIEDSPRNLILRNKEKEALLILEKYSLVPLSSEEIKNIINDVKDGANKELSNDIKEIFNKKFMFLTIVLSFAWFLNSCVFYGTNLVSTLTMKIIGQESNLSNTQIIIDQIIVNFIGLPSNVIGGILSEISFLGRKKSILLALIISLVLMFLLILIPKNFTIYFGLYLAFMTIAFNITITYSCEVFPTKIRDQAMGFLYFATRIGGFLSQIVYLYFQGFGIWYPYYFSVSFYLLQ